MGKFQIRVRWGDERFYFGTTSSLEEREEKVELHLERMEREVKKHIIGSYGEVLRKEFRENRVWFEIVGTEKTGKGALDAIDTVKNKETGAMSEVQRSYLFKLTRQDED